jgi:hypothetical protein
VKIPVLIPAVALPAASAPTTATAAGPVLTAAGHISAGARIRSSRPVSGRQGDL